MPDIKPPPFDLSLYLVTDQSLLPEGHDLVDTVRAAIEGGVTLVQLREKTLNTKSFVAIARRILQICRASNVPLLINDRIDVALAVDADGVHIGQDDMPLPIVRQLIGPSKIVGVTVETAEQAVRAVADGADYVGTAAIFPTGTKKHPASFKPLGIAGVQDLMRAVRKYHIPMTTIGGVGINNVEDILKNTVLPAGPEGPEYRLAGVAVVSAIIGQIDARAASAQLAAKIRSCGLTRSITVPRYISFTHRSSEAQVLVESVVSAFNRLRERKPLIHNITNYGKDLLGAWSLEGLEKTHMGGLPVMAHSVEEVADITAVSQALVINIGTLSSQWVEGMQIAGKKANEVSVPIIMDPVGAGATPYRKKACMDLIHALDIHIIKGNAGEVGAIAGLEGVEMRGVESIGKLSNPGEVAKSLARKVGTCVTISGPVDYVSDGKDTVLVKNGNEWLGTMTGTGCSTTTLVACFAAVEGDPLVAAVGGLICMGLAAELAAKEEISGPGSFKVALHDAIFNLDEETIRQGAQIEIEM
ncbi:hypothetical protein SpCBS45565_g04855 [Spizellomyces sp. 'palustris']|nr:hypothetical protein SpCBS45565_g04855 [Spizellomyces sp. 'palustris']